MATPILEAFVKLFADDSQLRASFQGLAPQAHLAGITVGERYAAGMRKAAAQAHAAFTKDFIGPLQSEAFGTGVGRGMEPKPSQQYRASDLAAHKGALMEVARAQGLAGQAAERMGGAVGGAHREFREGLAIARHLSAALLTELNPAFGAVAQSALMSARSGAASGVSFGLAVGGMVALVAVAGKYIERAREATEVTFQISQALKSLDAGRAEAQFTKAAEGVDRFRLSWDQVAGSVKAGWFERLIAGLDIVIERITDASAGRFGAILRAASANIAIANAVTLPKALASERAFNAGLLEREAQLNVLNAKTIEELNAAYDKSAQAIRDRTAAEIDQLKAQLVADTAAGKTAAAALTQIEINKKLAAQQADLAAKEDERQKTLIRAMDERHAHAVSLGRVSMQADLEFQRAALGDPRRTLQEQQAAEAKVFQLRRAMAEEYFRLQGNLGQTMWKEQLEVARNFLAETVEGSKAWFDQTQKIFDLYKGMREEARGIFAQQVSLAESEASRRGAKTISLDELPDYLRRVRERDERALGGGRVKIGDLSGAVSRFDFWRDVDRKQLSPREAFSRMMEDPSAQLARALQGVGAGATAVTPALSGLGEAAALATSALLAMAGAASDAQTAGRRRPGGPELSEENRGAILKSSAPFSAQELTPADSSALGRGLFLEGRRGPTTVRMAP